MKRIILYLFAALLTLVTVTACKKDKLDTSYPINGLGGDTWTKGAIDQWIKDTLTTPFNVEVVYKWDQFQDGDLTKTLVPPDEAKVIPMLQAIKKVWIDTYIKAASLNFMKTYIPKNITLVGSPSYNSNGSITLGEAEGGRKILLYTVNTFTLTDRADLKERFHTIEHEFAHILHQTVRFTPDYERISGGDYTGDWTNQSLATALSKGFITPYAMSARDEDFVEMVSTMLVEGADGFDAIVNSTTATGIARLRQKQAIVVSYFKSVWNIDFTYLQALVQKAIDDLSPVPFISLFGYNKQWKAIRFQYAFPQASSPFADSLTKANVLLKAYGGNGGRYIDSIMLGFTNPDTLYFRLKYINPSSGANLQADFRFRFTTNAAGEITTGPVIVFTSARSVPDGNAGVIRATMDPITNFLANKTLVLKWPPGQPDYTSPIRIGGLFWKTNDNFFVQGALSTSLN